MTTDRIRLGVSACLIGQKVRYDGGHKLDRILMDAFGPWVEWVPVCPEVECGLPIPREPMQLVGDPERPRLISIAGGVDHSDRLAAWARGRLDAFAADPPASFVFKSRSPSCGLRVMVAMSQDGPPGPAPGIGLWARAFVERFPHLPVTDEEGLHDDDLRTDFLQRVLSLGTTGRRRT